MFKDLDPLLHSQLRLAIVSLLMTYEEIDFNFIKEETQATSGNISVQITKLQEAGYIEVLKAFKNKYQNTTVKMTPKGIKAFEVYAESLKQYFKTDK
jgi:DNA-binding MarR family transcriptional regulator